MPHPKKTSIDSNILNYPQNNLQTDLQNNLQTKKNYSQLNPLSQSHHRLELFGLSNHKHGKGKLRRQVTSGSLLSMNSPHNFSDKADLEKLIKEKKSQHTLGFKPNHYDRGDFATQFSEFKKIRKHSSNNSKNVISLILSKKRSQSSDKIKEIDSSQSNLMKSFSRMRISNIDNLDHVDNVDNVEKMDNVLAVSGNGEGEAGSNP